MLAVEVERPLSAVAEGEQHAEERLMPAVNFFQFLGIDGQRDACIVRPQSVAVVYRHRCA